MYKTKRFNALMMAHLQKTIFMKQRYEFDADIDAVNCGTEVSLFIGFTQKMNEMQ